MKPWLKQYDVDVPHRLVYPQQPLFRFLQQSASRFPDQAAIAWREEVISYRQLADQVERLARGLVAAGLLPGDRVGLLIPNTPEFVLLYYAVLMAGGIVVAMNPMYKIRELEFLLNNSGARFLAGLLPAVEQLRELREKTAVEKIVLVCMDYIHQAIGQGSAPSDCSTPLREGEIWLGDLLRSPCQAELPIVMADDPAIFQYSGGTTGTPKAAIGLHRNLVANTLQFRSWLSGLEDGQEVVLAAIPLFHVYGMVIAMNMGIALGAKLVLVPNARDTLEILGALQKHHVTLYPGVPSMYHAINNNPGAAAGAYDLRSIKACISGSAPLLPETKRVFEKLTGGKLLEGYGLSEAPTATHCNPYRGENRAGSIGLPLPDVDCRLVDLATGEDDVQEGEAGELILHGPQVMRGYHQVTDSVENVLRNGWLHTGDIARMDRDGYFYLVDRKKDLIKVSGYQVWPREVEEVLLQHPAVREAAAAGIPEISRGEAAKAWVVLNPESSASPEELKHWCSQSLAHYKVPVEIEFRLELPRTAVGKILRRELVRQHLESQEKTSG